MIIPFWTVFLWAGFSYDLSYPWWVWTLVIIGTLFQMVSNLLITATRKKVKRM